MTTSAFTEKLRCYIVAITLLLLPTLILCQDCPAIACNDNIQISLDQDCDFLLDADFFIEGDTLTQKIDPTANFLLSISSLEISDLPLQSLGSASEGWNSDKLFGSHLYKIENDCRNSCWGTVLIESKVPPRIVNDPLTTYNFACSEIFHVLDHHEYTGSLGLNPELSTTCEKFNYNLYYKDAFNQLPNCADSSQGTFTSTVNDSITDSVRDDLLLMEDMHVDINQVPLNNFEGAPIVDWRADLHVAPTIEDCNLMLDIESHLKYLITRIDGTYDWVFADLEVFTYTVTNGLLVAQQITSFPAPIEPGTQLLVKASHPNADGTYSLNFSGDCFGGVENNTCIREWYISSMDHGVKTEELILKQTFKFDGLDLEEVACAASNFVVGCDVDNHPDSIFNYFKENVSDSAAIVNAYPHIITGSRKIGTVIYDSLVHEEIVIDTFLDKVFLGGEWVLVPIVNKEIVETIIKVERKASLPVIIPFQEGTHNCNIVVARDDVEVPICGYGTKGSHKVVRTWSIIDWCKEETKYCTQVFEVRDDEAPEFKMMKDSLTIGIDPWQCTATLFIPPVEVTDKCQSDIDLSTNKDMQVRLTVYDAYTNEIYDSERIWLGDVTITSDIIDLYGAYPLGMAQFLEPGEYWVSYTVADECGNESDIQRLWLEVIDNVPPVAICPEELAVTLIADGSGPEDATAKVLAEAFDNGSHDAGCNEVYFKVIRMDELEAANSTDYGLPIACQGPDAIIPTDFDKFGEAQDSTWLVYFDDEVKFCCGDENVLVVLRVFDQDPGPGPISPSDFKGSYNDCMIVVNLKLQAPYLRECAQTRYVDCKDDLHDMAYMGMPSLYATCGTHGVMYHDIDYGDPSCSTGKIEREWYHDSNSNGYVDDEDSYLCSQDIYMTAQKFDPTTIKWPAHYTGDVVKGIRIDADYEGVCHKVESDVKMHAPFNCSEDFTTLCQPEWIETSCGLIGYNVVSDTLDVPNSGGCSKIINRWTIIDWCNYDANSSGVDNPYSNDFEAVQDWCATDGCIAAEENGIYFRYKRIKDSDGLETAAIERDGYYTFDQVIKIIDTESPEIDPSVTVERDLMGSECNGSITITKHAEDRGCISRLTWDVTIINSYGDKVAEHRAFGSDLSWNVENIAAGTYSVRYNIHDGCNNSAYGEDTYIVNDNRPPTPYCISGVSTAVMRGEGLITVWASDFDLGATDNCDDRSKLRFTFTSTPPSEDVDFDESTRSSSILFTCEDLDRSGLSEIELEVYVWDTNDNADFCTVSLRVDDNGSHCDGDPIGNNNGGGDAPAPSGQTININGNVTTIANEMIDGVNVTIESNLPGFPREVESNQGGFSFAANPVNGNYIISAEKDDNYLNGVSTLDLVLIQQHIIGTEPFTDGYTIIAADASNDQSVSALDIIQLRQLILGLSNELPNNESWRFVESTDFIDQANPWPFIEEIRINSPQNNMFDQNFIGIKIGDVSGNAIANQLQTAEARSQQTTTLNATDRFIEKGEITTVVFESGLEDIKGFQMNIDLNKVVIQEVGSDQFVLNESNYSVANNELRMSVNESKGNLLSGGLFELTFKAKESGLTSQLLDLANTISSEVYISDSNDVAAVELGFEGKFTETMVLHQNTPNPFSTQTVIPFELPKEASVTVTIFDTSGKVVFSHSDVYAKGMNQLKLNKDEVATNGILYYQLQSEGQTISKKMMMID
jgi:hypothetical protein